MIPTTREELLELVTSSYEKLAEELDRSGASVGELLAVDDWTVKDLLAVRAWWTESLVAWIRTGLSGESPVTPAQGYKWNETPRLNASIVDEARGQSYRAVRARLQRAFEDVLTVLDELGDNALLTAEAFEWAGKWPISRWVSINTARQYVTARTKIRAALRS